MIVLMILMGILLINLNFAVFVLNIKILSLSDEIAIEELSVLSEKLVRPYRERK